MSGNRAYPFFTAPNQRLIAYIIGHILIAKNTPKRLKIYQFSKSGKIKGKIQQKNEKFMRNFAFLPDLME
jgi:hypothetical protein